MTDWAATDALIFDMDGTLWDAVDSYCHIWNVCFWRSGVRRIVGRDELVACMGLSLSEIYNRLDSRREIADADAFLALVEAEEERLMPKLGGRPYPGVAEGIRQLSERYSIFLLSNCGETGLANMMRHLEISGYIKEAVTYGATRRSKSENMRMLKEKYGLLQPVYVGDTESDCRQTHLAGLPFVHAAYGFGHCANPDMAVSSFRELTDFFICKVQPV